MIERNPADVQDIVKRLREYKQECPYSSLINPDGLEAAYEIERLRAALQQQAAMREALEFYASGIGHTEIEDNGAIACAALLQEPTNDKT